MGKEKIICLINDLIRQYNYKPVPITLEYGDVRERYRRSIPLWLCIGGMPHQKLYTEEGTLLCSGYTRIVIGDYGAYVEFSPEQAEEKNFIVHPGQEYREHDPRFAEHVKYRWLTVRDGSGTKIYHQKRTVDYADYKVGYYYVSVFDVFAAGNE